MMGWFRSPIHEPVTLQRESLLREPIAQDALAGIDCDELPDARGDFGRSHDNPISVNGLIGSYVYLGKLVSPSDAIIYFHRLGCVDSDVSVNPVDVYEVVDINGEHWDILYLDMYHPRRSNKSPEPYRLKLYDRKVGDIPFAFGVDIFCPMFPHDLADAISTRNGLDAFASRVRERMRLGSFQRPPVQAQLVSEVSARLISRTG